MKNMETAFEYQHFFIYILYKKKPIELYIYYLVFMEYKIIFL